MLHKSVLLNESINLLNIKKNGIYVDCTLGRAGHSCEILKAIPEGKLICFEQDQKAIIESIPKLKKISNNFDIVESNFKNLETELTLLNIKKVDGVLYDLGLSSPQLDDASRGFSYNKNSKLDMRMNSSSTLNAFDVVNNYSFEKLNYIFKTYGEEKFTKIIANNIIKARKTKKIETTFELVDIIKNSIPQKYLKSRGHPARKIFQAIRIEVNDELNVLKLSLEQALKLLNLDGVIVVISYHSLEDKIVKNIFKNFTKSPYENVNKKIPINIIWTSPFEIINKKIIIPSENEILVNNRARSAKLRAIKKVK